MRRALRVIWIGIQRFGRRFGRFNTTLILAVSFYVVLPPVSLIRRFFVSRRTRTSRWEKRPPLDRRHYEKQY